jgi:hypothetical protein
MFAFGSMPPAPTVAAVLAVALVFGGVILPAVWSRRPDRRAAAAKVLAQLLAALRRQPRR